MLPGPFRLHQQTGTNLFHNKFHIVSVHVTRVTAVFTEGLQGMHFVPTWFYLLRLILEANTFFTNYMSLWGK